MVKIKNKTFAIRDKVYVKLINGKFYKGQILNLYRSNPNRPTDEPQYRMLLLTHPDDDISRLVSIEVSDIDKIVLF